MQKQNDLSISDLERIHALLIKDGATKLPQEDLQMMAPDYVWIQILGRRGYKRAKKNKLLQTIEI